MAIEIERKFLVSNDSWRDKDVGTLFRQGYLAAGRERTVRVRLEGEVGKLTIKGPVSGISRSEYEYQIPRRDAAELLDTLCQQPLIEKTRYRVEHDGRTWEVDEFTGANEGLILAELELESEDATFSLPAWAGREVTGEPRYYNASLVKFPYRDW